MTKEELKQEAIQYAIDYPTSYGKGYKHKDLRIAYLAGAKRVEELEAQIEKMKWHKLDWDKAEESPDVDKLVRVRTKSGEEYICQTYLYYPTEDEIGYGSTITQFEELNGDWIDDNEIEYWCYIEPFKEIKEND